MNDTKQFYKGVFAVLLGSILGGLIAKDGSWGTMLFGIIIGGIAGWILYGPITFLRAVRDVWSKTPIYLQNYVKQSAARITVIISALTTFFFILGYVFPFLRIELTNTRGPADVFGIVTVAFTIVTSIYALVASSWNRTSTYFWKVAFWASPIGVVTGILLPIVLAVKNTVKYRREIGRFLYTFYKDVHGRDRYLCFVDSVIGVLISILLHGNVLLGAVLGTTFWIVNREFVAKRLLKIVPQSR